MSEHRNAQTQSGLMPFSKDVIQAIERGDIDTALKLIELQKRRTVEHNAIMNMAKRIAQGLGDFVIQPINIMKAAFAKKGHTPLYLANQRLCGCIESYLYIYDRAAAKLTNIFRYVGTKIGAGYDAVLSFHVFHGPFFSEVISVNFQFY